MEIARSEYLEQSVTSGIDYKIQTKNLSRILGFGGVDYLESDKKSQTCLTISESGLRSGPVKDKPACPQPNRRVPMHDKRLVYAEHPVDPGRLGPTAVP